MAHSLDPEYFSWESDTFSITPSNSTDLITIADAIQVGTAGSLSLITPDGKTLTLASVPVGLLPVSAKRVLSTGTTAAQLVGVVRQEVISRKWSKFDLAKLQDWSTYGYTLPDGQFVERSLDGNWRTGKDVAELLPSDWKDEDVWTVVYADPITGSDNANYESGLSWTTAYQSLKAAIGKKFLPPPPPTDEDPDPDPIPITKKLIIVPDDAKFWFANGEGGPWTNSSPTNPVFSTIIVPYSVYLNNGFGKESWTCSLEVKTSWAPDPNHSGVYIGTTQTDDPNGSWPLLNAAVTQSIRSGAVFDQGNPDTFGLPRRFLYQASEALVQVTPYTYALKGTNQLVVNVGSGANRGIETVKVFLCSITNALIKPFTGSIHIVNCKFEGGKPGFSISVASGDSGQLAVRLYGCEVRMTVDGSPGINLNGTVAEATVDIGLYRCISAGNGFDGVSYLGNCTFVESDCWAFGNGYYQNASSGAYGKINGFTTHNYVKGIRTNCIAYGNGGPNFADSGNKGAIAVVNLGCYAFDSWGDRIITHYSTDFAVIADVPFGGYDGSARVWLIDCKTHSPEGKSSTSTFGINVEKSATAGAAMAYFTGDWFSRSRLSGGATMANVTRLRFPT